MSAVQDFDTAYYSYDDVVEELEAEVLHLAALKAAQDPGSSAAQAYQDRINVLTARALALQAARSDLERFDRQIASARLEAKRAKANAGHAMDTAWLVARLFGVPGLLGLLLCFIWVPSPWLPIFVALFLLVAAGSIVMALRSRPGLYEAADRASAETQRLEVARQQLLAGAENGTYSPVPAPAPELPVQRVPLRVVPPRDHVESVEDVELADPDGDED